MDAINAAALQQALATDGEFLRASRQWIGSFAFSDGARQVRINAAWGAFTAVVEPAGSPAEVVFTGPPEGWHNVFSAVPPPFYQDLVGGAVGHHGFFVTGDFVTMSAYHGAIARAARLIGAVLRNEVSG